MVKSVYNVLFLCTGNSARSTIAEGILHGTGPEHFRAFSAGRHPRGLVNPLAIQVLERHGFPTVGLRSKHMDEFMRPGAPNLDLVITVCDKAAGEPCPGWHGQPVLAHWGVDDHPSSKAATMKSKPPSCASVAFFACGSHP